VVGDGHRTLVGLEGDGELVAEPVPRQAAGGMRQLGGERQKRSGSSADEIEKD
jgi:hypothetical protein